MTAIDEIKESVAVKFFFWLAMIGFVIAGVAALLPDLLSWVPIWTPNAGQAVVVAVGMLALSGLLAYSKVHEDRQWRKKQTLTPPPPLPKSPPDEAKIFGASAKPPPVDPSAPASPAVTKCLTALMEIDKATKAQHEAVEKNDEAQKSAAVKGMVTAVRETAQNLAVAEQSASGAASIAATAAADARRVADEAAKAAKAAVDESSALLEAAKKRFPGFDPSSNP